MKSSKRSTVAKSKRKRRYQPPKLVTYGDLRHLTQVKMGVMNDGGGKPMTKSGGANA